MTECTAVKLGDLGLLAETGKEADAPIGAGRPSRHVAKKTAAVKQEKQNGGGGGCGHQ